MMRSYVNFCILPTHQLSQVDALALEYLPGGAVFRGYWKDVLCYWSSWSKSNSPASHRVQKDAPFDDQRPATQPVHVIALTFDQVPPSHLVHASAPPAENFPLSHEKQYADRAPEYVPSAQLRQVVAPPLLHLPAEHAEQNAAPGDE